MNNKSVLSRIKSFLGGVGTVPSLPTIAGADSGLTTNNYADKASQMKSNIGWVYAVNQVIADDCSAVALKLYRKNKKGEKEEILAHEILDLLEDPSVMITARQMWNLYYQYLNLTGEVYILKLDKDGKPLDDPKVLPSALFPLPSHLCTLVLASTWEESFIRYNGTEYPVNAVMRDLNPDPENPYVGISTVRKAALTIDTDEQMKRWNNKLFKNGARPGIVVEVPDKLDDDAYNRLRQQFDEQYTGADKAFNKVLLEGGAKITPFMMSQQDLDFLESKKFSRDEILAMFRVSKSNLGIVEDVNRANAEAQEYAYAKRCIKPRLEQFVDFINKRLLRPIYGNEYELGFDNVVPEDLVQKLNESSAGVNKWLTIDEVRELYGYEPLPDGLGNQLYVPISNIPLQEVARITAPEPVTEPVDEEPTDDPSNEDNTPPEASGDEKDILTEVDSGETKLEEPHEQRSALGNDKASRYNRQALAYERLILKRSRLMFDTQSSEALAWLRENSEKAARGLSLKKKDWADSIVDWDEHKRTFAKDMDAILLAIVEEVGAEAYSQLMDTGAFDAHTDGIRKYLNSTASEASLAVNDETEKQLKATLAQGLRNGESLKELEARVLQVFGTASSQRAYAIAQTEAANAMSYADVEAWKQTGVVQAKEWFTAEDSGVCGFCHKMDGKTIELKEVFFNKGDSVSYTDSKGGDHTMNLNYREVGHPPIHPNCRCVLLPVIK